MESYSDNLRKIKSLLIVTSLQRRADLKAGEIVSRYSDALNWKPLSHYMIDSAVWEYITKERGYNPQLVFCHPDILMKNGSTSLYYRGLAGLSIKAAKDYFGSVEGLEKGTTRSVLNPDKALKMARVYNTFICSVINGSTSWTLENGKRTIIATLGISLDGTMRNRVGEIAEDRIRALIVEYIVEKKLIGESSKVPMADSPSVELKENIVMRFASEPDISFSRIGKSSEELLAIVEIKGGIDPAGALERYGAATKSFQHALSTSSKCKNFFLSAVFTTELERRISTDRLVEKSFDIIEILENAKVREKFLDELFHYTLRLE